jgi:hypothetical protein
MSPPEEADADADAAEDAPVCGLGIANAVLGNPGGGCGVVKGNGPGGGHAGRGIDVAAGSGPGGGPGGLFVRRAVSSFTRLCASYNSRLSGHSQ